MKLIQEDIKSGKLKQVYLLFGEEAYLRRQYRDRLRDALAGGDTMNCHYFEGKGINAGELIDLAETLPFLAQRRVLVIENSGLFKKGGEALAEYISDLSETAYFVFVETEVDKRSKLYKAVKAAGRVTEFSPQDTGTLRRWIAGLAAREKKGITDEDIRYFLEKTGTDMQNIRMELEKLFCYTQGRERITAGDIDAVCIRRVSNQIFDMVNAIAEKKQKRALELYYDLLALKEPPMRILFLMIRQYRILLQVKGLLKAGYGRKEIASRAGLHPFVAGKYMDQAKHFPGRELRAIMEEGAELEQSVKTGRLTDHLAVELFLVKYSS